MDNEICNVIDKLAEKFGLAVNWGNENIMPYIQDLIARYSRCQIINLGIWSLIMFTLMILCFVEIVYSLRSIKKRKQVYKDSISIQEDDMSEANLGISTIGMILSAIICPFIYSNLMQWIFIPDMKFMEEVLKMVS